MSRSLFSAVKTCLKTVALVSCLVLVASHAVHVKVGARDACESYPACFLCTSVANCGWCASSSSASCVPGNASGPLVSPGSCASWDFYSRSCVSGAPTPPTAPPVVTTTPPAPSPPNPTQPSPPTPPQPAPPSSCSAFPDCFTCTEQAGCGFCGPTTTCEAGSAEGPYNATCSGWKWTARQCSA